MTLPLTEPAATATGEWVQVDLAATPDQARRVYPHLARVARNWLRGGVITDFFFMHKPPGLRVRLAAARGDGSAVRTDFLVHALRWRFAGLIADAGPAVYTPEADRFGGPAAMVLVHRLFTVDSLTWLAFHTRPGGTPAWRLSLAMLRDILPADDEAVWSAVAAVGRQRPPGAPDPAAAAAGLRALWRGPVDPRAALPVTVRCLADRHAALARPVVPRWQATPEALASYVIFHWNRGTLGVGAQILISGALGDGR
ncbi:thiopeptide-type bacteriocin biosynthesis protein [Actinokineospora sp. NPDC004072]